MSGEHHGGAATRCMTLRVGCPVSSAFREPAGQWACQASCILQASTALSAAVAGARPGARRVVPPSRAFSPSRMHSAPAPAARFDAIARGALALLQPDRRASVPAARRRAGRTDPAESRRQPSRGHGATSSATPSSAVEDKTSWPTACLCDLNATTHSRTFQAMALYLQQRLQPGAPPSGLFSARSCARRASRALRCAG